MITQRTRGLNTMVTVVLMFVSLGFFWAYLLVFREVYAPTDLHLQQYVLYSVLVCMGLFYYVVTGDFLERNPLGSGFAAIHATTVKQIGYVAAFLLLYLAAAKDKGISRVFLFTFLPLHYLVLLPTNYFAPRWLASRLFRGWRADKTLLIGSPSAITHLRHWVRRKEVIGLKTVGVLCDETGVNRVEGYPVLGRIADLNRVIREHGVTQVVMAELPYGGDLVGQLAEQCDAAGARYLVAANLEQRFKHSITLLNDEGLRFISLRLEPLENPMNRSLKRVLDIVVSLPVVVLILPVSTFIVWLFQRLQSPGPILYRQQRAGIHDQLFTILKYRTMRVDNPDASRQASKDDDRIYPAGRIFRRFSIDELPQFLNVLRGEMSVVGPRPHLPQHNERFAQVLGHYRVRTLVKPGITGLAQVRGFRGETKDDAQLIARVESDIHYLENWSFTMDVVIILRTAYQMFFPPKTAY